MNTADADADSLLIARLAELLAPTIDGPTAAAVRAELDRLAGTPLPTLTTEHPAPHWVPPPHRTDRTFPTVTVRTRAGPPAPF